MLRILMQIRTDARSRPGGDTVLMKEMQAYLRSRGHRVAVSTMERPELSGFDVVHLFNLTRPDEAAAQARNALSQTTPYVLSPIYWDLYEAVPWRAFEFPRNLRILLTPKSVRRRIGRRPPLSEDERARWVFRDVRRLESKIVRGARFTFPGSAAERSHLMDCLGPLRVEKLRIVSHGVSSPRMTTSAGEGRADAVDFLCAGAIGPRKNQAGLVRAFRLMPDKTLLLVGKTAPGCARYRRSVVRTAGRNVRFQPAMPRAHLNALFSRTAVFIQPSYVETPGLAAMEAAAAGCRLVLSNFSPVREYFREAPQFHYCDPASPKSIARACRSAWRSQRGDGGEFAHLHQWKRVLVPLADAYAEIEDELSKEQPEGERSAGCRTT